MKLDTGKTIAGMILLVASLVLAKGIHNRIERTRPEPTSYTEDWGWAQYPLVEPYVVGIAYGVRLPDGTISNVYDYSDGTTIGLVVGTWPSYEEQLATSVSLVLESVEVATTTTGLAEYIDGGFEFCTEEEWYKMQGIMPEPEHHALLRDMASSLSLILERLERIEALVGVDPEEL